MATTTSKRTAERRDQVYHYIASRPTQMATQGEIADTFGWPLERVRSILRKGEGKAFRNTKQRRGYFMLWTVIPSYAPGALVADPARAKPVTRATVHSPLDRQRASRDALRIFEVRWKNSLGTTVVERRYSQSSADRLAEQMDGCAVEVNA